MIAFGKRNPRHAPARAGDDHAHHFVRPPLPAPQRLCVPVALQGDARDARFDRGLGDRWGHRGQHPGIERLGNDVVATVAEDLAAVRRADAFGHVLPGEIRESARGGELHLVVDRLGAHVESAAEDPGKAEHVVHLVRVVAAPRRHDDVAAGRLGFFGEDLRDRIREREEDGVRRQRRDHLLRDHALCGQADDHVGPLEHLRKGARLRSLREDALPFVHVLRSPAIDEAELVAHEDVLAGNA